MQRRKRTTEDFDRSRIYTVVLALMSFVQLTDEVFKITVKQRKTLYNKEKKLFAVLTSKTINTMLDMLALLLRIYIYNECRKPSQISTFSYLLKLNSMSTRGNI